MGGINEFPISPFVIFRDITNERQIGAVKYMDEWLKEKDKSEQAKRWQEPHQHP